MLPAPLSGARWLVGWALLLDFFLGLQPPFAGVEFPVVVLVNGLASLAAVVALFRPGWGLVLSLPPVAAGLVLPAFGQDASPIFVVTLAVCISSRWPLIAVTLTLYLVYAGALEQAGKTRAPIVVLMMVCAVVIGLALRLLLLRQWRVGSRIRALEENTVRLQEAERRALAGELSDLLAQGLAELDRLVAGCRGITDPASLAGALEGAERGAREALAQLRGLVSTLRGRPGSATQFTGPAPDVVEVAEEFEDLLCGHGHVVELDLPDDGSSPSPFACRLLGDLLRACGGQVTAHAPPGATCTLTVTCTPDGAAVEVTHPRAEVTASEPAAMEIARERIVAAGGTVEVSVTDHWRLRALVPTTPAPVAASPEPPRRWAWPRHRDLILRGLLWVVAVALVGRLLFVLRHEPAELNLLRPPNLEAILLAALLVAHGTRWVWVVSSAWIIYATVWFGPAEPLKILTSSFVPVAGSLLGMGARHFLRMRAQQRSQLLEVTAKHERARDDVRKELAGELHDIVAHQLTLITLQVSASRGVRDVEALSGTLDRIASILRSAQADLTLLLWVLRAPRDAVKGVSPDESPGGVALLTPARAAEAAAFTLRESGRTVTLRVDPGVDEADATTRKTLVRVIREATTNILRYAPDRAGCTIDMRRDAGGFRLTVSNDLAARARRSEHSTGLGLLGLAERLRLTGGVWEAGPRDGRWVVDARLPAVSFAEGESSADRPPLIESR
ncbi:MAG: histidine kinase [Propioniciclava sp.]|uniref:sensor histidine kinase n=1 Tax=Propioniciclava sp. TaxID=2038686 RepID=UPI0039E22014